MLTKSCEVATYYTLNKQEAFSLYVNLMTRREHSIETIFNKYVGVQGTNALSNRFIKIFSLGSNLSYI